MRTYKTWTPNENDILKPNFKKMKSINSFFTLSLLLFFSNFLFSQAESSPDEMAIHQIIQGMEDAWAAKNGEQFASYFTDDHDFIVWFGLYFPNSNREGNAKNHQGIFNTVYKNWDVELRVDKMRFIRPDLALVHTLGGGREKGMEIPEYPSVIQSILMEKTDGGWHIISFHNLDLEYDKMLRKAEPSDEEKVAYAREYFRGWYQ